MVTRFTRNIYRFIRRLYLKPGNPLKRNTGGDALDNPKRVWRAAQSAPSYMENNDLEGILRLSDTIYSEFAREVDWSSCIQRIKQFESPSGSNIAEYLPADYVRGAGEEMILHAITYDITGQGRS